MCRADLAIALLMAFLIKCVYVDIEKRNKVKLSNHDFLPIFMLLHIMPAFLLLLAALSSAVCLHNAFIPLIFAKAFCFH